MPGNQVFKRLPYLLQVKAGGIKLSREFVITGATTVGIVCKDGVVLASEKRVSYGFTVLSKAGKKVYPHCHEPKVQIHPLDNP